MIKFFFNSLLLGLLVMTTFSCGDDDIDCSDEAAINNAVSQGLSDIQDATTTYSSDPSNANCERLVDTFKNWIDEMEKLQDCADQAGQGAEFRQVITEARDDLSDIDGLCG